jgi:hypothetical protein
MKSRLMRLVGHVAYMVQMRNAFKYWQEILKERNYSEDLDVDRKIIMEWFLGKWSGRCGMDSAGSG